VAGWGMGVRVFEKSFSCHSTLGVRFTGLMLKVYEITFGYFVDAN
jgi:hypothetical protein